MGEMQTMLNWAKPGHYGSQAAFVKRFGELNQFDHLTSDEKVQQFRESVSDGAFFQWRCDGSAGSHWRRPPPRSAIRHGPRLAVVQVTADADARLVRFERVHAGIRAFAPLGGPLHGTADLSG
jgi:hypothetical protein